MPVLAQALVQRCWQGMAARLRVCDWLTELRLENRRTGTGGGLGACCDSDRQGYVPRLWADVRLRSAPSSVRRDCSGDAGQWWALEISVDGERNEGELGSSVDGTWIQAVGGRHRRRCRVAGWPGRWAQREDTRTNGCWQEGTEEVRLPRFDWTTRLLTGERKVPDDLVDSSSSCCVLCCGWQRGEGLKSHLAWLRPKPRLGWAGLGRLRSASEPARLNCLNLNYEWTRLCRCCLGWCLQCLLMAMRSLNLKSGAVNGHGQRGNGARNDAPFFLYVCGICSRHVPAC